MGALYSAATLAYGEEEPTAVALGAGFSGQGRLGLLAQAPSDKPAAGTPSAVKEPARARSVEAIYQQRDALFERRFTLEV